MSAQEAVVRWEGEVPGVDAPALSASVVGVLAAQGYAIESQDTSCVCGVRTRVPEERVRRRGRWLLALASVLLLANLYLLTSTDLSYESASLPIVAAVLVGGWGLSWAFRTARTEPRSVQVRLEGTAPALRLSVRGDESVGVGAFAALARRAHRASARTGGAR
ncbi:MAG: hypothetical protein VW450_02900 [Chloroflexota bacterium]